MRQRNKVLGLLLIAAMAVFGLASSDELAQAAGTNQIVVKFGFGPPLNDPEGLGAQRFAKLVEDKTDGQVKVQLYPLSQLGNQSEMVEGLRMGTIEMTMVTVGFLGSYEPILSIFELPYLFKSHEHSYRVFDGPVGDEVKKLINKRGFHALAFWEAGLRHLTNSKRPIKTPADLKGLKIRVPNAKSSRDALAAMGATPVPMGFPELYTALQQGVVDGQENPFTMPWNFKLYEVQKYLSLTGHQLLTHVVLYSDLLWKRLPANVQKALEEAAVEAAPYQRAEVRAAEQTTLDLLVQKGHMVVNEVDQAAFRKAVRPLWDEYIKEFGSTAKHFIDEIDKLD